EDLDEEKEETNGKGKEGRGGRNGEEKDERMKKEEKLQQYLSEIEEMERKKKIYVATENYLSAQEIQSELKKKEEAMEQLEKDLNLAVRSDHRTWSRLLSITCDLLEHLHSFQLNHPGIAQLLETTI